MRRHLCVLLLVGLVAVACTTADTSTEGMEEGRTDGTPGDAREAAAGSVS